METFDSLWRMDARAWEHAAVVLVKLVIATVLTGIVGWQRERKGRPAGIRTHMLVGIGVVLFTESSRAFTGGDPGRVAAQIVTGIGFLGAGTILRHGGHIKGLTTAASIWAVAGIAMCLTLGGPYIVIAVVATGISLFVLSIVDNLERHLVPERNPTADNSDDPTYLDPG